MAQHRTLHLMRRSRSAILWQAVPVGEREITMLDGGLGQELQRHGGGEPTPLWSAQVMTDQPELVKRVHLDYLRAGADVITINAYSATRCRLGPAGREADFEGLQRLAGELAVEARAESNRPDALIAGCLSPYEWSYRPELTPPYDDLWPRYAEAARIQAPYVDVMICETMGSIDEGRAAARGAAEAGVPIWLAWSVLDDQSARLRSGEPLAAAIEAIGGIDAVLLNCSVPEAITTALPLLAAAGLPFGGYANGFDHIADEFRPGSDVSVLSGRHDLDPRTYADVVSGWIDEGATIVGGCCEIGPDHIRELARRFGRATAL
jgi:S-methylmethionine-dependent homocysteine/selenocysteine methylase